MKLYALAVALLLSFLSAWVAGKSTDVLKRGTCTGRSSSKLKLSEEDGNLEVEFEVDMNKPNRKWNVVIKRNGVQVFSGVQTTNTASGSFEVRKVLRGLSGTITATATSQSTTEKCTVPGTKYQ